MQAEVDRAADDMAREAGMEESDDGYDSVDEAKDEVLLELSEKLDEAEDELARKEVMLDRGVTGAGADEGDDGDEYVLNFIKNTL